jgi:hypothetical protein
MGVSPSEFELFEFDCSLFDMRIDNVPIWECLRFDVFCSPLHGFEISSAMSNSRHYRLE